MCRFKIEYKTKNKEETFNAGFKLADRLTLGDVIALYGDLGTGKTLFTQGICKGLNVVDYVTSPSFTIVQEYKGNIDVIHFDLYRLSSSEQVENLGIYNYFEKNCVSIIEWPQLAEEFLPKDTIIVRFSRVLSNNVLVENERIITVEMCKIKKEEQ